MNEIEEARILGRVDRLQSAYVDCIDNDRLESWQEFFTEECLYRILPRESYLNGWPAGLMHCEGRGMLRDRILSLRRANIYEPHWYRHLVSSMRLKGEEQGGWRLHTNFAIVRTMRTGEQSLFVAGFYDDVVVEQAGKLLFRERTVVLDSNRVDTLLVIPV
ncbi:MAG: aromatic-ring-hydroxylating dioxygenase subunit beta [Betaproteobacteria bacterium]|nr:aromatic-ring-hydroxylating dioxygenase subunit beta [Betaproteobacteria bacterium]